MTTSTSSPGKNSQPAPRTAAANSSARVFFKAVLRDGAPSQRRSAARTRARSSAGLKGLVMKSSTPKCRASSSSSAVCLTVSIRTGSGLKARILPQPAAEILAVELGHHPIHQDHLGPKIPDRDQALLAVRGQPHFVALGLEHVPGDDPDSPLRRRRPEPSRPYRPPNLNRRALPQRDLQGESDARSLARQPTAPRCGRRAGR